eukprot:366366-Chlamydomonas_euryale.AAC.23
MASCRSQVIKLRVHVAARLPVPVCGCPRETCCPSQEKRSAIFMFSGVAADEPHAPVRIHAVPKPTQPSPCRQRNVRIRTYAHLASDRLRSTATIAVRSAFPTETSPPGIGPASSHPVAR